MPVAYLLIFTLLFASTSLASSFLACQDHQNPILQSDYACLKPKSPRTALQDLKNVTTEMQIAELKKFMHSHSQLVFDAKRLEIQIKRACALKDYKFVQNKNTQLKLSDIEAQCEAMTKETQKAIATHFSPMKVQLALANPELRERRLIADRKLWFSNEPEHLHRGLGTLPKLTAAEYRQAERIYLSNIDDISLRHGIQNASKALTSPKLVVEQTFAGKQSMILNELEAAREIHKRNYQSYLTHVPELSYAASSQISPQDLAKIYETMEKTMDEGQKTLNQKTEYDRWALHVRMTPMMENILSHRPDLCQAAELLKRDAENEEWKDMAANAAFWALSSLPCLSTGFIGIGSCVILSLEASRTKITESLDKSKMILSKTFLGPSYVNYAELSSAEKQVLLNQMLLPLAFWVRLPQ